MTSDTMQIAFHFLIQKRRIWHSLESVRAFFHTPSVCLQLKEQIFTSYFSSLSSNLDLEMSKLEVFNSLAELSFHTGWIKKLYTIGTCNNHDFVVLLCRLFWSSCTTEPSSDALRLSDFFLHMILSQFKTKVSICWTSFAWKGGLEVVS